MNSVFIKRNAGLFFIILFSIPLLFFNVKDSHDWGCDFAQYIHQAENIIKGIPQSKTGFIFNEETENIGPPAYPIGFPLLLSPVYYFFGNSIKAFAFLISSLLVLVSICMYLFYKKYFSSLTAVLLVLIFIYNPWVLNFKLEIMSEIPFTLLFFVIILLGYAHKTYSKM